MRRYLIWGLAAYFLFLIATFPAEIALGLALRGQTDIGVSNVEGTLWSGSAGTIATRKASVGPVVWDWRPTAVLLGRLEYDTFFQLAGGGGEARVGRGLFDGLYLKALEGNLNGAQLTQWVAVPGTQLGGSILVDLPRAEFSDGTVTGLEGSIVWENASIIAPVELALGTLQVELSEQDGQLIGTVSDRGGPIAVSGAVALHNGNRYGLNAKIKPRADADPALQDALGLLGQPDRAGNYAISYSGTL